MPHAILLPYRFPSSSWTSKLRQPSANSVLLANRTHHKQELVEFDGAVAVLVDQRDHVLQLGFGRPLAQRSHHDAQLGGRDAAIEVLVEQ